MFMIHPPLSSAIPANDTYFVGDFGADRTGTTDLSAAFLSAIIAAAGKPVYVPKGEYLVDLDIATATDVHLVGEGTLIYNDDASACISYAPPWGSAITPTAMSDEAIGGSVQKQTRITVDPGDIGAFDEGQVWAIYSDDKYIATDNAYMAELFVVSYVDTGNNHVYASRRLHGNLGGVGDYTVENSRLRKLPASTFIVDGLRFRANGDVFAADGVSQPPCIKISGAAWPVVRNVVIEKHWGVGVNCISCFKPEIEIQARSAGYDASVGQYSYMAVAGGATTGGRFSINGITSVDGFTTSLLSGGVFSDANYRDFGMPAYNLVHDSHILGSRAVGLGTHHAFYTTFTDCIVEGGSSGAGSSNVNAFSNRAAWTTYNNCRAIGCYAGFEENASYAYAHYFETRWNGCETDRLDGTALSVDDDQTLGGYRAIWNGGKLSTDGGNAVSVNSNASSAELTLMNCSVGGEILGRCIVLQAGTTINLWNVEIDLRRAPTYSGEIEMHDGSTVNVQGLQVFRGPNQSAAGDPIFKMRDSFGAANVIGHGLWCDDPEAVNPTATDGGTINLTYRNLLGP